MRNYKVEKVKKICTMVLHARFAVLAVVQQVAIIKPFSQQIDFTTPLSQQNWLYHTIITAFVFCHLSFLSNHQNSEISSVCPTKPWPQQRFSIVRYQTIITANFHDQYTQTQYQTINTARSRSLLFICKYQTMITASTLTQYQTIITAIFHDLYSQTHYQNINTARSRN